MKEILERFPLSELTEYYEQRAKETLDAEEHQRCMATAFYLKAYDKLPF